MDELISPAELAKELGVSVAWLAQRRYQGDGPTFIKIGLRKVRYRKSAVEDWLILRERTQTRTSA